MRIGVNLSLVQMAVRQMLGGAFTPATLFANSEPGVWYDPSDLTTLFQDSAGTTPVTAVEQPVGLMLDKSKGLVLGPELVTNGDFSSGTTGWTAKGTASINASSGALSVINSALFDGVYQDITTVSGKWYSFAFNVTAGSGFYVVARDIGSSTNLVNINLSTKSFSIAFLATGTSTRLLFEGTATATLTIDNISVRELPGNHAYQTTSTSRPVLSARYNLLTKTEQFDDAVWAKSATTVTANAAIAPDGSLTADKLYPTSTGSNRFVYQILSLASGLYRWSLRAKAAEKNIAYIDFTGAGTTRAFFDLSTGAVGSVASGYTATITNLGNGWYECAGTNNVATAYSFGGVYGVADANGSTSVTTNGTDGIYIWGASLVPANQASLPYQRVNTATDYDSDPAKFPRYLKFDGIDDWMVTPTINFNSTDKMTVFAGVRDFSTATASIVELSPTANGSNGSWVLYGRAAANGDNAFGLNTGASFGYRQAGAPATFPYSAVLSVGLNGATGALSTAVLPRINGGVPSLTNVSAVGVGSFGNYPIYIGRRGGASLPFNGQLFQLIVRGAATDAATIVNAEKFVGTKTGVTL